MSFISTMIAILFSFGLGAVAILFSGGKTTLQYMQCKIKRKSKILVWVDSFTGRESVVGKIEGNIKKGVISWKFNGEEHLTIITHKTVGRWKDIYYVGVNLEFPLKAYDISSLGDVPVTKIDLKEFQHLLNRALTQPSLDDDMQQKMMLALAFGMLIIIGILAVVFFKIDTLMTVIEGLNVIS